MRSKEIMRKQDKTLLQLFTVLLCFSSLTAIPLSRNLALRIHQPPPFLEVGERRAMGEVVVEEMMNRRMEIELNDYRESGANPRHEPRNP